MQRIELKDAFAVLRRELSEAIKAADAESLRFQVGEITLQFQVEVERSTSGAALSQAEPQGARRGQGRLSRSGLSLSGRRENWTNGQGKNIWRASSSCMEPA